MDQALAAFEELSSRVHDLFSDAGPGVLSALRDFAAAVDWKVKNGFWGTNSQEIKHLVFFFDPFVDAHHRLSFLFSLSTLPPGRTRSSSRCSPRTPRSSR